MKKQRYWFKIDNAGKVFPSISNQERSNTFRLSMSLHTEVDPQLLTQAVNMMLPRFEAFAIQIKTGVFWQYFAENHKPFVVTPESAILTKYFHPKRNKGYLFKIYYFDKRVTLETFHALTDGSGALAFLTSVLYQYLTLKGHTIDPESLILGTQPMRPKESEDAFLVNYDKSKLQPMKEIHAFHLKGEPFQYGFSNLLTLKLNIEDLKKVTKDIYGVTITQYFSAVICYAIMKQNAEFHQQKKPLKLFIPINLRPYFDAITLRNFSLYLKTVFHPEDTSLTFKEVITKVKQQFETQLTKDNMLSKIAGYVSLEKVFWIRLLPFFLKNIAFKIGYDMLGAKINTASFSNLGLVKLPKDMQPLISDVNFIIGGFGVGISAISYQQTMSLNLASRIKDTSIMKEITQVLYDDGIQVTLISNYKEAYDGLL